MKTVYTTLPIYKNKASQTVERAKNNQVAGFNAIYCPKHRLPSFQWIDDGAATVDSIFLMNENSITDITSYFVDLPELYSADEDYFIYNGATLNHPLPCGYYYLKIVMDNDYVYYSDWFTVENVYSKFAETFVNNSFDTFTISGTTIASCIDAGANAYADSTPFRTVHNGQVISVIFFLTETGATNPQFSIVSTSLGVISNVETAAAGLNELTLTTTQAADDCFIRIQTTGTTNFSTTEILVFTQFCDDYVTLSFTNCCNVGDILYETDFIQTLWLKGDNIEETFPYVERGQENGAGRFIPTFRRQDKTYIIKTEIIPKYLVDTLHRLKLHDVITFIDQVGDAFIVQSIDIEHEWIEGKYWATATITIDLDEAIVAESCCN